MPSKLFPLVLSLACSLTAQRPEPLADINTSPTTPGRVEYGIAKLGAQWVFRGTTPATGDELFVCTAPSYAVSLLRDVHPGRSGSNPEHLTVVGNLLFFFADDGVHGMELWVSDGTSAGTRLAADVRPGPNPSVVVQDYGGRGPLAAIGSSVFFVADDGVHGAELWRSDGSSAGTGLVADLELGAATPGIRVLRSNGTLLFFSASSGSLLWRSDGTAAGTIPLGAFYAPPYAFTAVGATMFFVAARNTAEGYELWRSDGTVAGTVLVKDIFPGPWNSSSYPAGLTAFGTRLFFEADDGTHGREPWISDGTPAGTLMLRDVAPGSAGSMAGYYLQQYLALGTRVVFAAADPVSGMEPWVTDGTSSGTVLLRDLHPGAASSLVTTAFTLWRGGQAAAGRGWFAADDGVRGSELWTTDGTPSGTALVADLVPGSRGSVPSRIVTDGSGVALVIADAVVGSALSVATTSSASLVTSAVDRAPLYNGGSSPRDFTVLGGQVLFAAAEPGTGNELWATDGTGAGTARVLDIHPGPDHGFATGDPEAYGPGRFRAKRLGNQLVFSAYDAMLALGLWRSDGTAAGTTKVRTLDIPGSGYTIDGAVHRDRYYFRAYATGFGWSVFVTDGTTAGTSRLASAPANVQQIAVLGNRLLWFVNTFGAVTLFAESLPNGPRVQVAALTGASAAPLSSARVGNRLFFIVAAGSDTALWVTDGVTATRLLPSLGLGTVPRRPLVRFGDRVFFAAGTAATGVELWSSDGTTTGTLPFADLVPGPTSSAPRSFAVAGDRLYFAADQGAQVALWQSDGTAAGTVRVASMSGSGYAPPDLLEMTAVGSRHVYFSLLYGETFGSELWRSDGTPLGTALVADAWPGTAGPPPSGLLAHRGRLLFAADDGWSGSEPWVLEPGATAMPYGAGCAASGIEPELSATDPLLGQTLRFTLRDAVANTAGVALLGYPSFPEVQLGLGCSLALQLTGSLHLGFTTDALGRHVSPALAVPSDTSLVGQMLVLQGVLGPTGNQPFPFDLSTGVLLTFGS